MVPSTLLTPAKFPRNTHPNRQSHKAIKIHTLRPLKRATGIFFKQLNNDKFHGTENKKYHDAHAKIIKQVYTLMTFWET